MGINKLRAGILQSLISKVNNIKQESLNVDKNTRIALFPRSSPVQQLLTEIERDGCQSRVDILLDHKRRVVADWQSAGLPVYTYPQFIDPVFPDSIYNDAVEADYKHLLGDHAVWMLGARKGWVDSKNISPMLASMQLLLLVRSIHAYIRSRHIVAAIFHDVPHVLFDYVFYRVLESRRIPALYCYDSPLRGYHWLVEGIENPRPWKLNETLREERNVRGLYISDAVDRVIDLTRQDYRAAMPDYMRSVYQGQSRLSLVAVKRPEIKALSTGQRIVSRVKKIVRMMKKGRMQRRLFNTYLRLAHDKPSRPYIYVALHTQPEATTLPRAGHHVQQFSVVASLSAAVGPGITIAVREHPDTFHKPYAAKKIEEVRSDGFYKTLAQLPNVELIDMNHDPFDLVDKSITVATATGVVGLEATIRGKSVLAFGGAQYLDCPGIYPVKTITECRNALAAIQSRPNVALPDVRAYLKQVEMHAVACTADPAIQGDRDISFQFYVHAILNYYASSDIKPSMQTDRIISS